MPADSDAGQILAELRWRFGFKEELLARAWVHEAKTESVESYPPKRVSLTPIRPIPDDRVSGLGHVNPYLILPPRLEFHFEYRAIRKPPEYAPVRDRRFSRIRSER